MIEGIKGILYSGEHPTGVSCDVAPRGDHLEARVDGGAASVFRYNETAVSLTGVDDRYIGFESSSGDGPIRLLVADRSIVPQLTAVGAPRAFLDALNRVTLTRSRRTLGRRGIFAALGAAVLLLALAVWAGFGWAVERAVDLIPREWERELGRSAAAGVLEGTKVCSDPAMTAATRELGTRLVGALEQCPYDFKIRVLDDSEVNAFALPGGYLFIHRGLLEQASDSDEVAGVLAHEIQHVMLRHGVSNLVRQAGFMILLQALVGDASAVERTVLQSAADLASMSFSREQESEADRTGLALLRRASLDGSGLERFLARLAGEEGKAREALTFLTTHPASGERAEALKKLAAEHPPVEMVPLRFRVGDLKGRCDPVTLADPDGV